MYKSVYQFSCLICYALFSRAIVFTYKRLLRGYLGSFGYY